VYIVLERLLPMFRFLERAISIILVFIGVKILIRHEWLGGIHIGEAISLGIVIALLLGSVVLSKIFPAKEEAKGHGGEGDEKPDAKAEDAAKDEGAAKDEPSPAKTEG
jgi:predicted tellurium resistance membrane protein TerC